MPGKAADRRRGGQAVVVTVAVASAAGEMGTGAVQNRNSREKVAWVCSASIAAVSLLLAGELDEGNRLSLKTAGEDPGWVWSLGTCCR